MSRECIRYPAKIIVYVSGLYGSGFGVCIDDYVATVNMGQDILSRHAQTSHMCITNLSCSASKERKRLHVKLAKVKDGKR